MVKMNIRRFGRLEYKANEAFNTLCTNLLLSGVDVKKIMVTSVHPSNGKTFIAMNLMRSLAQQGKKVVMVDADIRASVIKGTYDVRIATEDGNKYPGLTKYLANGCSVSDILGETNIPNAWMILAGRNVMNSMSLLSSPRLKTLFDELSEQFDVVIVDAAPAGTIIDAVKISESCDGTLVVVESGEVSRQELKETIAQLEKTNCPILGMVLNKFDERKYGNNYYHKSYYSNYYSKGDRYGRYARYGIEDRSALDGKKKKKAEDSDDE